MFVKNFTQFLQYEKRYSPHTITAYTKDLDQFYNYLSGQYQISSVKQVTHPIIRSWIVTFINEGISHQSINRKIASLRSYFKFLVRENKIKDNPAAKITPLKQSKKLPVFVDEERMHFLFDQIEFKDDFEGIRDKFILEILYSTGIRLTELINLKTVDIDSQNNTIKVLGKRNKERLIPYNNSLNGQLTKFKKIREKTIQKDLQADQDFLLLTGKGKKLYPKLVYRIVNKYLGMISTLSKKSPHVLRHTYATHLLNNGADINAIKELLGHTSLAATQVYTHNTIDKLKKIYKQAHPKS